MSISLNNHETRIAALENHKMSKEIVTWTPTWFTNPITVTTTTKDPDILQFCWGSADKTNSPYDYHVNTICIGSDTSTIYRMCDWYGGQEFQGITVQKTGSNTFKFGFFYRNSSGNTSKDVQLAWIHAIKLYYNLIEYAHKRLISLIFGGDLI